MDSDEDYARQQRRYYFRTDQDCVVVDTNQNGSLNTSATSIFIDPDVLGTCLTSMTIMLLSLQTRSLTISFLCKSRYKYCLITELGIDNALGNPTHAPTTLPKGIILDNHESVHLEFQSKMKHQIFTVYLNYRSVTTNSNILQRLLNTPGNLIPNYIITGCIFSISGQKPSFSATVILGIPEVVRSRCKF